MYTYVATTTTYDDDVCSNNASWMHTRRMMMKAAASYRSYLVPTITVVIHFQKGWVYMFMRNISLWIAIFLSIANLRIRHSFMRANAAASSGYRSRARRSHGPHKCWPLHDHHHTDQHCCCPRILFLLLGIGRYRRHPYRSIQPDIPSSAWRGKPPAYTPLAPCSVSCTSRHSRRRAPLRQRCTCNIPRINFQHKPADYHTPTMMKFKKHNIKQYDG